MTTCTWIGLDSGWDTDTNWLGGIPTSADDVVFDSGLYPLAAKCIPTAGAECKTISGDGVLEMQLTNDLTVFGDCDLGAIVMDRDNSNGTLTIVSGTLTCAGQMISTISLYLGDVGTAAKTVTAADDITCHIFHTYPNVTLHMGGHSLSYGVFEGQPGAVIDQLGTSSVVEGNGFTSQNDMVCIAGQTWQLIVHGLDNLASGTFSGCDATGSDNAPLDATGLIDGGGNSGLTFGAAPTYALTMSQATDNTDASPYAAGTVVSISAAGADPGFRFDHWESDAGGTFDDITSADTNFTMPANDVTAHAVFIPIYVLTVANGSGDGEYAEAEEVTLTADAPAANHLFYGWASDAGGIIVSPYSTPTKFIMPANAVTVTASYIDTPSPVPSHSLSLGLGIGL